MMFPLRSRIPVRVMVCFSPCWSNERGVSVYLAPKTVVTKFTSPDSEYHWIDMLTGGLPSDGTYSGSENWITTGWPTAALLEPGSGERSKIAGGVWSGTSAE